MSPDINKSMKSFNHARKKMAVQFVTMGYHLKKVKLYPRIKFQRTVLLTVAILLTLLFLLSCGQVVAQHGVIYNQRDHGGGDFVITGFSYGDSLHQFEVYDRKCECGITFWKDSSMTIWGDTTRAIRLYIESAPKFPKQSENAKLYEMHRRKLLDLLGWIIKRRMDELEIIKANKQ